ncbi:MAG TPA: type 1 glutamine amidotransferase [Candidatus Binatia bacterium]|nr:type 1 glutamine amidotransferase [Candidatus Binatia bacterium]
MEADGEEASLPLLVVIEHADDEGPGLVASVAARYGANLRRVGAGDPLPGLEGLAALVVMGGPGSLTEAEPRLAEEVALVHDGLTRGLPILGICLGAQLLAAACGAPVRRGERGEERGLGTVTLTPPGRDDLVFAGCGDRLPVVHWHQDAFEVPRGACHLARGDLYPNQAFRLGRAYGFQFHLEVDSRLLAAWATPLGLGAAAGEWLRQTEPVRRRVIANWMGEALSAVP